ncbi:PREDICTED: putative F-box protein At1g31090 isoform X2 [Camelina sativa]|uniref:F-box protein At1g31090 isoform X2 n=1 Tax=Camelina sativa TaxID=90675 RepID=A0ABM0WV98_CAMSA|nr:PREDICTED: putative F-box protein At1g31090 isoform X2 [Camelina sativa]
MNRGANSVSLPNDLIYEILSRLPAKSIKRFRCVSKLWESIICRKDFTELFHTRSLSNPRLLLIKAQRGGQWSFFSMPQNHYGKSSFVVADSFQMKFFEDRSFPYDFSYASGLIYFRDTRISKDGEDKVQVICNPSTGQYAILPPGLTDRSCLDLLGFDPIEKQYKGKVGMILEDGNKRRFPLKLHIWVLEDVGKEELTAYAYTLRDENRVDNGHSILCVARVTASGEIVLANTLYKPYYVYFFNLERNTLRRVEIPEEEKWSWDHRVYYFVDHVEDLRFDVMKTTYAAKSISRPEQSTSSSRGDHQVTTVAHEQQDY